MNSVQHKGACLRYVRRGHGPAALIIFHGFGQSPTALAPVLDALPEYTGYQLALMHHGSDHRSRQPLNPADWRALFAAFLARENIKTFDLMGFSLGGKVALCTLHQWAPRVRRLWLLAPDGLRTSFWYSLATYPGWTQRMFRTTVLRPALFLRAAHALRRLRLADSGLVRFAERRMRSRAQRYQVYRTWITYAALSPDLPAIKAQLRRHRIATQIFLGAYDRVIAPPRLRPLLADWPALNLTLLPVGHNDLVAAVSRRLRVGLADDAGLTDDKS